MTKDKIKKGIYTWGFYPALVLLKEEEDNESYEKCRVIKEALDEVGVGREWYLSSNVDDKSMDKTYQNLINSHVSKPEIISANMSYYIDEFKKYVNDND